MTTLVILLLLAGWGYRWSNRPAAPAEAKVIAVLPFANQGAGADFDYLRYAIADDLVSDLTYTHSVTVRPFAATSRYGSQSVDPATVGKELRVTHVVAGGFLLDKYRSCGAANPGSLAHLRKSAVTQHIRVDLYQGRRTGWG